MFLRSRCIIAHLTFTNIVLSCGFLLYTFLIDIYYDVDSFNTLIHLNAYSAFAPVWPLAKVCPFGGSSTPFTFSESYSQLDGRRLHNYPIFAPLLAKRRSLLLSLSQLHSLCKKEIRFLLRCSSSLFIWIDIV